MAALIPILMSVAPGVIQLVEKLFGSKTGQQKMDTVFGTVITLLQQLAGQGKIDKTINDDAVKAALEVILQQLKATGQLTGTATDPAGQILRVVVIGKG